MERRSARRAGPGRPLGPPGPPGASRRSTCPSRSHRRARRSRSGTAAARHCVPPRAPSREAPFRSGSPSRAPAPRGRAGRAPPQPSDKSRPRWPGSRRALATRLGTDGGRGQRFGLPAQNERARADVVGASPRHLEKPHVDALALLCRNRQRGSNGHPAGIVRRSGGDPGMPASMTSSRARRRAGRRRPEPSKNSRRLATAPSRPQAR